MSSRHFLLVVYCRRTIPAWSPGSWGWKFSAVFLRASGPSSNAFLSLCICKLAQYIMKEIAEHIISIGDLVSFFVKTNIISCFRDCSANGCQANLKNYFLSSNCLLIQIQYCSKELGDISYKTPHDFAMSQSKNKWGIVSFSLQNKQFLSPDQFFLAKLSFMRIAFCSIRYIQILIFGKICTFQIHLIRHPCLIVAQLFICGFHQEGSSYLLVPFWIVIFFVNCKGG